VNDNRDFDFVANSLKTIPFQEFLPELLEDLWELGGYPEIIVELLPPLHLPSKISHVLDLACGKGAVGITLAEFFGFNVLGIDAFAPFLEVARQRAKDHGVSEFCQFQQHDLRTYIKKPRNFDLVIYASVGPVLGNLVDSLWHLRRSTHAGGYILIDDAFLTKGAHLHLDGYTHYMSHHSSVEALTKWGDRIIAERKISKSKTVMRNKKYIQALEKGSERIIANRPEFKKQIDKFIENQIEECRIIETHLTECIWLIQKKE
jgi:cyclopropane fatty-acyl-phospholipid synthase-like methyltransferase